MKVCISTLGCKLNQAESDRLARQLLLAGYEIVASPHDAELHIVNTCAVTHTATRKSRKALYEGRQQRTDLITVLTGCYVEMSPHESRRLPGVDLAVGNQDKERLLELLETAPLTKSRFVTTSPDIGSGLGLLTSGEVRPESRAEPQAALRTRAFVKIQDGCNMGCTFCIIPLTRGRERSRPRWQVLDEIKALVAAGHQEVVLTGVRISTYRDDTILPAVLTELTADGLRARVVKELAPNAAQG